MSEVKVNKISPRTNCGTVQLGDSGDTITIPAGATITNNGTAAGFGATGAASWDTTVKTASFTGVAGVGYFVNTTSGAITVTLPASPDAGAVIAVKDYANTFDTNNVTLARNGSNIGGDAVDATLSTEGVAVTLVYVDATKGWLVTDDGLQSKANTSLFVTATGGTVTTCGDFKIHTFTGPGTFCVSCAGNSVGSNTVDYLVTAGGGGAGEANPSPDYCYASGGGGAGGFRYAASTYTSPPCAPGHPLRSPTGLPVSVQGYPITVGGGGPGGAPGGSYGTSGSNSIFSTITSTGGGRGGIGGQGIGTPGTDAGASGGSGGGAGAVPAPQAGGGTGNTPPVSPPQGNPGGTGTCANFTASGGGGGAIAAGNNGAAPPTPGQEQGGNGGAGAGLPTAFGANGESCGSFRYYAGGGGGGATYELSPQNGTNSTGGVGGGGDGRSGGGNGPSGTTNTGAGGGGVGAKGGPNNGGSGGSGIVVIRYKFQ